MHLLFTYPRFEAYCLVLQFILAYLAYFGVHQHVLAAYILLSIVGTVSCLAYRGVLAILGVRRIPLASAPGVAAPIVGALLWVSVDNGIGTALVLPLGIGLLVGGVLCTHA